VQVSFRHSGLEGRRFAPEVETAAYRIVQEALTNVARHAHVNEAAVRIWTIETMLVIQIKDQGVGFEPEAVLAANHTSGLTGMRERALLQGGHLVVESSTGKGTCLTAELPVGGVVEQDAQVLTKKA
jgi:signal transduction histidine kinase